MALKFVKRAGPGKKKPVKRIPRKSLLLSKAPPRQIVQLHAAIDDFGELPPRKRTAAALARGLGHDLDGWHRRSNDPAGRWNAFCVSCNAAAVVCTETPEGFRDIYGPALTLECQPRIYQPSSGGAE